MSDNHDIPTQQISDWIYDPATLPLPPDPCPYCGKPRHGLEDTVAQLANPMKFLNSLTTAQCKDTTAPFGPTSLHYDFALRPILPRRATDRHNTRQAHTDSACPERQTYSPLHRDALAYHYPPHGPGRYMLQLTGTTGWLWIVLAVTVNDTGSIEPAPWQTLWECAWGPQPLSKRGPRAERFARSSLVLPAGNIPRSAVLNAPKQFMQHGRGAPALWEGRVCTDCRCEGGRRQA